MLQNSSWFQGLRYCTPSPCVCIYKSTCCNHHAITVPHGTGDYWEYVSIAAQTESRTHGMGYCNSPVRNNSPRLINEEPLLFSPFDIKPKLQSIQPLRDVAGSNGHAKWGRIGTPTHPPWTYFLISIQVRGMEPMAEG